MLPRKKGLSKPNRRIFETALQKSGCASDQAVMIGDRIDNDILPARQLGMHTVWVRQGFGQYWKITNEAEKPDYQVDNLAELASSFYKCNLTTHQLSFKTKTKGCCI